MGAMAMKAYSTCSNAPGLEPHHQIGWSYRFVDMQLAYFTAPVNWANRCFRFGACVRVCVCVCVCVFIGFNGTSTY